NIPNLQQMAMAYLPLGGSADELREQIVEVALDRAFLAEPLPTDAASFARRIDEGRGRLMLIAQEVARLAAVVLAELQAVQRKLAERRGARDPRLDEFRWWLEELRIGLFAQELKTPQPVSVKRLDKIWAQVFA